MERGVIKFKEAATVLLLVILLKVFSINFARDFNPFMFFWLRIIRPKGLKASQEKLK